MEIPDLFPKLSMRFIMSKIGSSAAESDQPTPSEVHRKIIELYNDRKFDEGFQLIATDAVDHVGGKIGDQVGRHLWRKKLEAMESTPFTMTIVENVSQRDLSVNRYRVSVRDPKSGKSLEATGLDMVRVRDGQIVEHWGFVDMAALFPHG
jgi:ketosteroid isomerase-like protein